MQVFYDKNRDIAYIHFASSLDPDLRKELKFITPSWKVKRTLGGAKLKIYLDDCAKIVGFEFAHASCVLRPEFLDPATSDDELSNSYDAHLTLQYDPEADAGAVKLYPCQKGPRLGSDLIGIPAIEAKYGAHGEVIIHRDDNYIQEIEILWISKCIREDTMRDYACEYDFDEYEYDFEEEDL